MSVPPSMSDVDLPTRPTTTSPLLSRPGAVAGEGLEAGVALHHGDPMREQRLLEEGLAVVDLSHRDVVTVTGPDRLSWLHSLTTQHLLGLEPRQSREALILSPKGHVEHSLHVVDDGVTTWVTTEPGAGPALVAWLDRMRFMLRVEVSLWLTGESTWMAVPGRAEEFELPYAAPLVELRDAVLAGGRLTVCTQCAARRELTQDQLVDGAVIKGAAVFVEEAMAPGAQALVY